MFTIIKKIWEKKFFFRSLLYSIYFNFRFLPFKQAVHLPILFYKPCFNELKGKFIIDCEKVKMGMIQLGALQCSLYPNSGIVFENHGGIVVFKGICVIGNASAISVGENGYLELEKLEMIKKQQLGEIKNLIDYEYALNETRKKNEQKEKEKNEKEESRLEHIFRTD